MKKLELLAPAGNPELGMAAISHGADAVYIGADRFGAREAAGNPAGDIEKLVKYAHRYRAGVYVTLNTILLDSELEEAGKLAFRLYEAGVDALIVQDMAMLELDLPPMPLFASTQTHNYDIERIRFLEEAGFERIILARELSLKQIREIRSQTTVDLESFVHGALCVCFSGQCYLSSHIGGRSANRGSCGQPCRLPWSLSDSKGNTLAKNKYLLSLKDLNLSGDLEPLVQAGISSFKIEGRLKDTSYIKNVTGHYRKKLDRLLEGKGEYAPSSSGKTRFFFDPDPEKTFNRGYTDYFLNGRKKEITAFDSPKAKGKPAGKVHKKQENFFTVTRGGAFQNGDGICFFDARGDLTGLKVNKVQGEKIFPANPGSGSFGALKPGMPLYRNFDSSFSAILKGKTSERKVPISFRFSDTETGFVLQAEDHDGFFAEKHLEAGKEPANHPENVEAAIKKQLSKTGGSIFSVSDIRIHLEKPWFIRPSLLNEMRRETLQDLLESRENRRVLDGKASGESRPVYPWTRLDHRGNVSNRLAEQFYRKAGVVEMEPAFEVGGKGEGKILMTTRHCLRYSFNMCTREKGGKVPGPLYLEGKSGRYRLEFDCARCVMNVID